MKKLYLLLIMLFSFSSLVQAEDLRPPRRFWGILDVEGTNPYRAPSLDFGTYGVYDDLRFSALLSYQPVRAWQFGVGLSFAYGNTEFRIAPTAAVLDARVFPWKASPIFGNARLSIPVSAVRGGKFSQYGTLSLALGGKFDGLPIPLPFLLDDIAYIFPLLKLTASVGARLDFLSGRRGQLQVQPGLVIRLGVDI